MRRLSLIIALLLAAISVTAEVKYLLADEPVVADENVQAVEVRVARRDARVGNSQCRKWSLSWEGVKVDVVFDFRNFVEGIDEPRVKIECGGRTATLDHGFDAAGGYNTLALEWADNGSVTVLFGQRELYAVMTLDSLPQPRGRLQIMPESVDLDIADILVEHNPNSFSRLMTDYSAEELAQGVLMRYLDRENDPKVVLSGGRYVMSRVGNDLVYMSGAQTNATHWHRGMLKGRLKPTGFVGYYHLEWYDATGRLLSGDCYAQEDFASKTMTFVFPSLSASLRFALGE